MAKKNGGGGSQLAQLKARLAGEGISDRRQMKQSAKKRKRGQASSEREEQQARREKLQRIASSSQFNPFEEKITKPKNAVLGRHIRGAVGKPGEARQGGLQDRKENLLPEWKNRNKSGSFVDRRFGEGSGRNMGGMNMEDAMLERFTRERQQRANKTSMFNLDDAEEEGLTHYGRSLNDLDEYDDIHLSDEETGEDRMAHFGGFGDEEEANEEEDEGRQKTKAEVMKEVMAKSKAHKMERQQVKMQDEELRQQLDDDFGDLRSLLMSGQAMPEPVKEERKELPSAESAPVDPKQAKENAYDAAVREMVFERRAKPQDRLKTEAEKAQELAEKLQKAEDQRLRRMRGEDLEDETGNNRKGRKGQPAGGDDLEDDFELDGMTSRDVYGLGQGLRGEDAEDEEDDDEEQGEEEDEEEDAEEVVAKGGEDEVESDEAEEDDDFDDLADMQALAGTGEEIDSDAEAETENIVSKSAKKGSKSKATSILPFTFPCPATLDELLEILSVNKVGHDDIPIVVKRIRAVHHASLAEDNKFKLQTLVGVLLDYILHISVNLKASNKSETMNTINSLVPQLYTLTKTYPIAASEHFVGKLALMQRNLTRGLSKGALNVEARTWPGVPECILLKVTSTIWPTSDRSHPVTTPLALLICQYLSSCRVRNIQDIIKGLFLTSLVAENERQSRRLVPEALNFLHNAITLLLPSISIKQLSILNRQFGIPWPDVQEVAAKDIRLGSKVPSKAPTEQLDFLQLIGTDLSTFQQNAEHDTIKSQTLIASMTLVEEFARLYSGSVGFVELLTPFEVLLGSSISKSKLPTDWLEQKRSSTHEKVSRMVNNTARQRRALRLQAHRAIPIASHIPKFDQGFNPERKGGRTFDPDAQRAEVAKLRALAKKERKGAMRELRRDNEFLADARREAREEEDSRYAKQIGKIMGSLSAERGEEKAYLREKQNIKRRAGKK